MRFVFLQKYAFDYEEQIDILSHLKYKLAGTELLDTEVII